MTFFIDMDNSIEGIWGNPRHTYNWVDMGSAPEYPTLEMVKKYSEERPRVKFTPVLHASDYDNYLLWREERAIDSFVPFGTTKVKGNYTGVMNVLPNWAKPIPPKWTTCLREMCDKCKCPIELLTPPLPGGGQIDPPKQFFSFF